MDAGCPGPDTRALGALGEALAASYLRLRGYRLLARNLRVGQKEIDLLAADGACLVGVEVKLRRGADFGRSVEALRPRQLGRLRSALRSVVRERGWRGDYRLDLVAIDIDGTRDHLDLDHYRGL